MKQRVRPAGIFIVLVLASAAFSALAAPPAAAVDDAQEVDKLRAAIAATAEKALQMQGGCRILFKVDAGALREAMLTDLRDDVYRIVREGRIPFAGLALREGGVEVRISDAKNKQRVLNKLVPSTEAAPSGGSTIDVTEGDDGLIRLAPTNASFAERLHGLVRQSMEMIEQLLPNSGIRQAGVKADGADRIRILLPAVMDCEAVAAMFGKKAQVAFRLVDVSKTVAEALRGPPSPTSEVRYDFRTKDPYLLLNEIAVSGDDIIDAAPGFAPESRQPIASFRFNAHGTRRFAQITESNVGRPFAIVVDDKVLSVSVIQEPIVGGSGVISGNFTLEQANTVAMLLRSGTLPGRLSVVDRQVVEPTGNTGK